MEPATYQPRVSPDGNWLAFVVVHESQAQVGVMKLDSGEWWVLTRSRDRGQVLGVAWSRDSTRIFFDRFLDVPAGVFSASPLDRAPEGAARGAGRQGRRLSSSDRRWLPHRGQARRRWQPPDASVLSR